MRMQRLEPPPQFCLEEKHSSAVVKVHSSLKIETYSEALGMTSFYFFFFWKKKFRAISVDIKTRQFIIKYFRRKLSPDSLTQIILLKYYFTFIETSVSTGNDRILLTQILAAAFSPCQTLFFKLNIALVSRSWEIYALEIKLYILINYFYHTNISR